MYQGLIGTTISDPVMRLPEWEFWANEAAWLPGAKMRASNRPSRFSSEFMAGNITKRGDRWMNNSGGVLVDMRSPEEEAGRNGRALTDSTASKRENKTAQILSWTML